MQGCDIFNAKMYSSSKYRPDASRTRKIHQVLRRDRQIFVSRETPDVLCVFYRKTRYVINEGYLR